jgi:hypothetical protein
MFARLSRGAHQVVAVVPVFVAIGALALVLSSCAKHPNPNPDAATHPITIQIDNNLMTPTVFAIWIQEAGGGGTRRQVVNAPGAQVTTMSFTPRMFGVQYTLEAVPPIGSTIRRNFSIDNESITSLKWDLRNNVLSYFGQN